MNRMCARTVATAARSSTPASRISRATRSTSLRIVEYIMSAPAQASRVSTTSFRRRRAVAPTARARRTDSADSPAMRCALAHAATARSNSSEKSGFLALWVTDGSSSPPPVRIRFVSAANDAPAVYSVNGSIVADQRDLTIATLEEHLVCHEDAVVDHPFTLREHVHDAELTPVENEEIAVRADLEPSFLLQLQHLGRVPRDEREKLTERQ